MGKDNYILRTDCFKYLAWNNNFCCHLKIENQLEEKINQKWDSNLNNEYQDRVLSLTDEKT